jgi:hypothetical protein
VIGGAAPALARRLNWLYLDMANRRTAATPVQPISTPREIPGASRPARKAASAIAVAGAALGVILGLGAALLWFHYGTAVFFETIASGLSACF